ncbi:MAG: glycine--tRNA ligase subunit beta, partial [Planctomycetota bacterium]|nr:glycine--tRNA ligase subunit beta [Planctomycetota bacterium]
TFLLGFKPTGSQDPYGLRRQAFGIIKIIMDRKIILSLNNIWNKSVGLLIDSVRPFAQEIATLPDEWVQEFWKAVAKTHQTLDKCRKEIRDELNKFIEIRLHQMLIEQENISPDIFNAVLHTDDGIDNVLLFKSKVETLVKLSQEPPIWDKLVELGERTYNISRGLNVEGEIKEKLLQQREEQELYRLYQENKDEIEKLINEEQYEKVSRRYCEVFATPAHIFFEKVFVNVEEDALRNNRLLLNKKINQLYSQRVADLSRIPRKKTQ